LPGSKVDRFDLSTQNGYMSKQFAKRIADLGRLQISGCYLVKHRRKEREVISAHKSNLDIGALCRGSIEVSRRLYAGESASQNDDLCSSSFLTGIMHHVQEPQALKYSLLPCMQISMLDSPLGVRL
jgi:hypothetical protein